MCYGIDWTGAQIGNNDSSDDIKDVDLTKVHNLSGPVAVEGAEPGDCLVVDILDGVSKLRCSICAVNDAIQ